MDSISLRVFFAILVSDGMDLLLQRALAHRMFMFDKTDRWWILHLVPINHNIIFVSLHIWRMFIVCLSEC